MIRVGCLRLLTGEANPAPHLLGKPPGLTMTRLVDPAWLATLHVRNEADGLSYLPA